MPRYFRTSDSSCASTCSLPARRFKISLAPSHIHTRRAPCLRSISFLVTWRRDHRSSHPCLPPANSVGCSFSCFIVLPSCPRLSHRYSRDLLEARGKMRQVVVRSRSPRTRERCTYYSSLPSLSLSCSLALPTLPADSPSDQQNRTIHSCRVYYACVCLARVYACRRARALLGPVGASRRGRYIFLLDD